MNLAIPRTYRTAVAVLLCLSFLSLSVFAQHTYDASQHADPRAPVHKFVLPASVVQYTAFGFRSVLADTYWVMAIQDYLKWDSVDTYYPEYFSIISALDPKFEYPYLFGILTIPSEKVLRSKEWLEKLVDRGAMALPNDWNIPFSAAVEYHTVWKDVASATGLLRRAVAIPDSPEIVQRTYAIYLMRKGTDYEQSRALLTAIRDTSDNPETKRIIEEKLTLLDYLELLTRASQTYKERFGSYPVSVERLVGALHILPLPEDLKKYPVAIDLSTGNAFVR